MRSRWENIKNKKLIYFLVCTGVKWVPFITPSNNSILYHNRQIYQKKKKGKDCNGSQQDSGDGVVEIIRVDINRERCPGRSVLHRQSEVVTASWKILRFFINSCLCYFIRYPDSSSSYFLVPNLPCFKRKYFQNVPPTFPYLYLQRSE